MMQPRSASTHSKINCMMRSKQLVDVQRVADGQRRAIHDLQIAAGPREPRVLGRPVSEDGAAFFLRHGSNDTRAGWWLRR